MCTYRLMVITLGTESITYPISENDPQAKN